MFIRCYSDQWKDFVSAQMNNDCDSQTRIGRLKEEKRKLSDELWDLQEQGADGLTMQALRQRRFVYFF